MRSDDKRPESGKPASENVYINGIGWKARSKTCPEMPSLAPSLRGRGRQKGKREEEEGRI